MSTPLKVGIVGCGVIAGTYLTNRTRFESFQITACADKIHERAEARATEFDIPTVCSVEELLANPEIDLVLNLTIPAAHADVSVAALEAGKHVYTEKPLAATADEGRRILRAAKEACRRVGSAPDTFLGAGGQTSRHILDGGWIGDPVAAARSLTWGRTSCLP